MGRSFPVFLFCFAMDPFFHYLNQIPRILSVQAYVDDATIVADAQRLDGACKVSSYQKVKTAGFIIESHYCYRSLRNSVMKFGPKQFTDEDLNREWPSLAGSRAYGAVTEALQDSISPGYNTIGQTQPTVFPSARVDHCCRSHGQ